MILDDGFLNTIPMPAIVVGSDDRIALANHQSQTLFGQGLVGRSYVTMLRQPALLDCIERTLQDQQSRQIQIQMSSGAQDLTYAVTCRYVALSQTAVAGSAVVCFEDMTPLEQANRMRRDFVANVSHELRTPLTAMMGFIETLQGPAKDDHAARARFLAIMETEAARMNRLVGDLLSLSKVEETQRQRPKSTVNLNDTLSSTVSALSQMARNSDMVVTLDVSEPPVTLPADADQLRQVFTNLIENALKYSGAGKTVNVSVTSIDHDPALRCSAVRVEIKDNGAGIDPIHLPRLTERFYRADAHRSREKGGTGLGLAIVKHILNRHRGKLLINSALGQGATFTVVLPL